VSTTTPRRDHDHATAEPDRPAVCITSGNAAPITNEAVAQHLGAGRGCGGVTRYVDELAAHMRRLGNHELNELLIQLPKPRLAALVEVALAHPLLPAGLMLRFEPANDVDGWTVVACAPRR
jgi:hypothetical protein